MVPREARSHTPLRRCLQENEIEKCTPTTAHLLEEIPEDTTSPTLSGLENERAWRREGGHHRGTWTVTTPMTTDPLRTEASPTLPEGRTHQEEATAALLEVLVELQELSEVVTTRLKADKAQDLHSTTTGPATSQQPPAEIDSSEWTSVRSTLRPCTSKATTQSSESGSNARIGR